MLYEEPVKTKGTVWITGGSSGLGLHTANAFRDAGWFVIAGARSFAEEYTDGIHRIPLDVTDEDSISAFCTKARALRNDVDALVQCAGVLVLGSCEETSLAEYEKVMNTNFFGMVRMNRHVLPLMRQQGRGKIIMYSSINGLMGIPFQSAYTASKHAIEGYAETLRQEVQPFGIQVMLVEPGDHRSGSNLYRSYAAGMDSESPYYAEYKDTIEKIHHDETNGSDPDRLGRIVEKTVSGRRIPLRKRIASVDQHLAVYLHRFLGGRLNTWVIRKYYIHQQK